MINLISYLNKFQTLDNATEEAIKKYFVKETFDKNELIVSESTICTKVYYIESGLIRRFYNEDGEEKTKWIYDNNQCITLMSSYFSQKPSRENLQACEKTVVYSISYINEQILLTTYPLFSQCHIKQLRLYISVISEFHQQYELLTAREKYIHLLTHFPEIIQKAKLKHIASLINVSQETLSRIRASII